MLTTNARSARVPTMAYMNDRIVALYVAFHVPLNLFIFCIQKHQQLDIGVKWSANGLALLHIQALQHPFNVLSFTHGDGMYFTISFKLNFEAILQLSEITHIKLLLELGLKPNQ